MMLQRSTDADFLNRVLNHPEVARWMCGFQPPFDLSSVLGNDANVFLANKFGGFLFVKLGKGRYEVHTQLLPEGRGNSLELAKDAAWYMFTQTDCMEIQTYSPKENLPAWKLTVSMGFRPIRGKKLNGHQCTVFSLDIKTWARSLCQQQQ